MQYREFHPPAPLGRYLECIWLLAGEPCDAEMAPQRIFPDGCVEAILHFGDRFEQHDEEGRARPQPPELVVGQLDRPMLIRPTGRVEIVGIRFRPAGAFPFFRIPVEEFNGKVLALEAVLGSFRREMLASVNPALPLEKKAGEIARLLHARLSRSEPPDRTAECVAGEILRDPAGASVSALARAAGLSSRQLERKFRRHVGLEPKLFCRIQRFQRVFRTVEQLGGAPWAEVAVECGFYDQAHFIKECRQFSGLTPPVLFSQLTPMTEQFTRKNR